MNNETPICKDCGQPMIKVGTVKEPFEKFDFDGEIVKTYATFYQCPEDKNIAIH